MGGDWTEGLTSWYGDVELPFPFRTTCDRVDGAMWAAGERTRRCRPELLLSDGLPLRDDGAINQDRVAALLIRRLVEGEV